MIDRALLDAAAAGAKGALAGAVGQWLWDNGLATRGDWRLAIDDSSLMTSLCATASTGQMLTYIAHAANSEVLEVVPHGRREVRHALATHALTSAHTLHLLHGYAARHRDWRLAQLIAGHPSTGADTKAGIVSNMAVYENAAGTTLWQLRAGSMDEGAVCAHSTWPEALAQSLASTQPALLVKHWGAISARCGQHPSRILGSLGRWDNEFAAALGTDGTRAAFHVRAAMVAAGKAPAWQLDDHVVCLLGAGFYSGVDSDAAFHAAADPDQKRTIVRSHARQAAILGNASEQLAEAAIRHGLADVVAETGLALPPFMVALAGRWDEVSHPSLIRRIIWDAIAQGVTPSFGIDLALSVLSGSERHPGEWLEALATTGWRHTAELAAAVANESGEALPETLLDRLARCSGAAEDWVRRYAAATPRCPHELLARHGVDREILAGTVAGLSSLRPGWDSDTWYQALTVLDGWGGQLHELLGAIDALTEVSPSTLPGCGERS